MPGVPPSVDVRRAVPAARWSAAGRELVQRGNTRCREICFVGEEKRFLLCFAAHGVYIGMRDAMSRRARASNIIRRVTLEQQDRVTDFDRLTLFSRISELFAIYLPARRDERGSKAGPCGATAISGRMATTSGNGLKRACDF